MVALEVPQGFVVRLETQKAAWDNGYRIELGQHDGWACYRSTNAPGRIWLGAESMHGPWWLSFEEPGPAAILSAGRAESAPGAFILRLATASDLHLAVDKIYRLSLSLPPSPLRAFERAVAGLPKTTEAERLVVQRIGQDKFREALLAYWNSRCPMTGINDERLLRASHIVPWAACADDAQRLDVHNGILLSSLWDAAFDAGLVTFGDDGSVQLSPRLSSEARTALVAGASPTLLGLAEQHLTNLAWHRRHIFLP